MRKIIYIFLLLCSSAHADNLASPGYRCTPGASAPPSFSISGAVGIWCPSTGPNANKLVLHQGGSDSLLTPLGIGQSVPGGTAGAVLYINGSGNLAQDIGGVAGYLTYDGAAHALTVLNINGGTNAGFAPQNLSITGQGFAAGLGGAAGQVLITGGAGSDGSGGGAGSPGIGGAVHIVGGPGGLTTGAGNFSDGGDLYLAGGAAVFSGAGSGLTGQTYITGRNVIANAEKVLTLSANAGSAITNYIQISAPLVTTDLTTPFDLSASNGYLYTPTGETKFNGSSNTFSAAWLTLSFDGSSIGGTSSSGQGAIRYNNTTHTLQKSENGGGWVTVGTVTSVATGTGLSGGTITGSGTLTVNQSFSPTWTGSHTFSNAVTLSTAPVSGTDAANKTYVDSVASGLNFKDSVYASTGSNIASLIGGITMDGVVVPTGSRVLLRGQSPATTNGIWVTSLTSWTRPADFANGSSAATSFTFVENGSTYADTGWVCTAASGSDIVGTNNLPWAQFSGAGTYSAGTGLTLTGTTFAIDSTVATLTGSQVLTNKTLTAPIINGATSASGNFDLSGSSGTEKTTTGAFTFSGAALNMVANTTLTGASSAINTTGLTLTTNVANGGTTSTGLKINNTTAFTTDGEKLVDFQNAGTSYLAISYNATTLGAQFLGGSNFNSGFVWQDNASTSFYIMVNGTFETVHTNTALAPFTDSSLALGTVATRWTTAYTTAVSSGASDLTLTPNARVIVSDAKTLTTSYLATGTAQNVSATIQNTTAAALGAQQYSPVLELLGNGWDSTASSSKTSKWGLQAIPVQTAGNPTGQLGFYYSTNAGAYAVSLAFGSGGTIGPSLTQQHTVPAVTSDTFALLAATQTLSGKTLTAPVINGATSASGNFDLSGSSGTTKTTTGAVTIGGGAVGITGQATFAGGILASGSNANDFSGGTGAFKVSTGASTFGGSSSTFTNAVTISPTTNQLVLGAAAHLVTISSTAPSAAAQTLTIPDTGGADTFVFTTLAQTLASKTLTAPVINGVTSSGSTNIDWSGNSGAYKTTTGAVTIGSGAISLTGSVTVTTGKFITTTSSATVPPASVLIGMTGSYTNSWVDFGGAQEVGSYYKDALGFVHLEGTVKSGTSASAAIFTLPVGYRPIHSLDFAVVAGAGTMADLNITSAGVISATAGGSTSALSFNGAIFYAEQ